MKETNKKEFSLRSFLLRTLTDPVLWYTVLIMISLMFHYRNRDKTDFQGHLSAVGWGVCSFLISWVMFRIFDYMQKHHILGFFIYTALVIVFGAGVRNALDIGQEDYPILWGLWFLTPQDSLEYNFWYTLGFYLLFMLFMGSVIYYFTRVRYRIFMNFLIFIIPFAIYGKEYEKMPTLYIILLAVGYILLMVYYRQLSDTKDTLFVERRKSWKPIAVYAVIFAIAAAITPKPKVEADRTILETLISADQFTDKLNAMIDVFRDTTTGEQFGTNRRQFEVYEVKAEDELHIKTATYSTYSFDDNSWRVEDIDDVYGEKAEPTPLNIGSRMGVADAFLLAARLDSDYAEEYGLTEYAESGLNEPELKEAVFYTVSGVVGVSTGSNMAPVPQFAVEMTDCTKKGEVTRLRGGTVYSVDSYFSSNERFTFTYSRDTFFASPLNRQFVDKLAQYDYDELLRETRIILLANIFDTEEYGYSYDDAYRALNYLDIDRRNYDAYLEYDLDYGSRSRIKELADRITEGCETEYDKAKCIEAYFYNNDYIYDLEYRRKKGDNAETFLFDTKTGVCYDYATAMVLLARAAGIPARYCEGYNMTERNTNKNSIITGADYVIRENDAHGFPELYIKGYGWTDFEPTISDGVVAKKEKQTATDTLSSAGIIILAGAMLVFLFALVYPWLSHRLFILICRKRSPNDAVKSVIHRICKVYDIESFNTSQETAVLVHEISGADITDTAELFDTAVYGDNALDERQKEKALDDYIKAYEAFRESKKRRRITSR